MTLKNDITTSFSNSFFSPMLSSLMNERKEALILGGIAGLQFCLVTAGLPGWTCPFKAALGIPCPACGLSTAVGQLLHGNWNASIHTHAFAPIFLFGVVLVLTVSVLPESVRTAAIQRISSFEKRTGITAIILLAMFCYWGFRLIWH